MFAIIILLVKIGGVGDLRLISSFNPLYLCSTLDNMTSCVDMSPVFKIGRRFLMCLHSKRSQEFYWSSQKIGIAAPGESRDLAGEIAV